MALRNIRVFGDPLLTKKCRRVEKISGKIKELIDDMFETMYASGGVGLAAPQIGVLRRIVVIDVSEEQNKPYVLINPEIIEATGEQTGNEGCLSLPGKCGIVTRPMNVKVKAFDADMKEYTLEGEGLLARAICHECDHLDGILFSSKAPDGIFDVPEDDEGENSAEQGE